MRRLERLEDELEDARMQLAATTAQVLAGRMYSEKLKQEMEAQLQAQLYRQASEREADRQREHAALEALRAKLTSDLVERSNTEPTRLLAEVGRTGHVVCCWTANVL